MKLSHITAIVSAALALTSCSSTFNAERALSGGAKLFQAATITDAQVQSYVAEYIAYYDKQNTVLPESDAYTRRLRKMTSGITSVDGLPLNFKVYKTQEANAFACADGSVRVYTGLMDLMTDDELLGVIGHEIGHVALKHSKKQFKNALLTSALKDGIASTSTGLAALTDSQLGALGEAVMGASFSKKQESESDDYGYEFLKKMGRNPWGMAMSFEKLQSLESGTTSQKSAVNQLLSSHPDTATRISRMSAKATKEGYKRP